MVAHSMAELDVQTLKAEHSRGYLPLVRALHVAVAVAVAEPSPTTSTSASTRRWDEVTK
jgi:hypothetical protein